MVVFLTILVAVGAGGVGLYLDDDEFEEEFHHEDLRAAVVTRMMELPKPNFLIVKSGLVNGESLVFELPQELQEADDRAAAMVSDNDGGGNCGGGSGGADANESEIGGGAFHGGAVAPAPLEYVHSFFHSWIGGSQGGDGDLESMGESSTDVVLAENEMADAIVADSSTAIQEEEERGAIMGGGGGVSGMNCIIESFSCVGKLPSASLPNKKVEETVEVDCSDEDEDKDKDDDDDNEKEEEDYNMPTAIALFRQRRAEAARTAQDEEALLCSLCCEQRHDAVFLTCGHGGVCFSCAVDAYVQSGERCPFCRARIGQIVCVGAIQKHTRPPQAQPQSSTLTTTTTTTTTTVNGLGAFMALVEGPIFVEASSPNKLSTSAATLADRYSFDEGPFDDASPLETIHVVPVIGPNRGLLQTIQEFWT